MKFITAKIAVLIASISVVLFVLFNPPWKCALHIGNTTISKYWGFHTILKPPNSFDYFFNLGDKFHLPLVETGRYDPRILNAFEFNIDYSLAAICIAGVVIVTLLGLWIVKFSEELIASRQA
ncbi:MAG: hypothetical protein WC405_12440 [Syntrophales bacterium]